MKITLIYIGKDSKDYFRSAADEYYKRIHRYCKFEIIGITPPGLPLSMSEQEIKEREATLIYKKIPRNNALFLLDQQGKKYNSRSFADFIDHQLSYQNKDLCFVIGGALGFSERIKDESDQMISLSPLTFPHHLARIVFLEQLYRAFTIIKGEPYHNE